MKTTALLVFAALTMSAARPAAAQTAAACDRECLRSTITASLYALLKHDTSKLPVSDRVRVTEDGIEKPLAKVGLLSTVTRLRGYRQDILDERAGMAGADVIVEEVGAPVMLVVRLKVVDRKITEIETVATRSRSRRAHLQHRRPERAERSDELRAAAGTARLARGGHQGGAALSRRPQRREDLRRRERAVRAERLSLRERPGHGRAGLQVRPGLPEHLHAVARDLQPPRRVQTRVIGVDERLGIVWLRMAWGVSQPGGDQLTVWESFKVYDGQIHAVEAFMRILPVELSKGGWE